MSKYAIQVWLLNGETQEFKTKAAAYNFVSDNFGAEKRLGRCKIWYSAEKDFWNEFEFGSVREFHEKLDADTEKGLLHDLAD